MKPMGNSSMEDALALPAPTVLTKIAIRWPALSVLRMHEVLAWFVLANATAWLFARFAPCAPHSVMSTQTYMLVCLAGSTLAATYWLRQQWRGRIALPARQSMSLLWSPLVDAFILALLFSPALFGGRAMDERTRSLVRYEQLEQDYKTITVPTVLERGEKRALADPLVLLQHYPGELGPEQRAAIIRYSGTDAYDQLRLCLDQALAENASCTKRTLFEDPIWDHFLVGSDGMQQKQNVPTSTEPYATCTKDLQATCGNRGGIVSSRVFDNLGSLAKAHRLKLERGHSVSAMYSVSELPSIYALFSACVATLALLNTCLTIFNSAILLIMWFALSVLGLVINFLSDNLAFSTPPATDAWWLLMILALCVVVIVGLFAIREKVHARSDGWDMVVVFLLWCPYFALALDFSLGTGSFKSAYRGGYSTIPLTIYQNVEIVAGGWTVLATFPIHSILSRYRSLPWAS